MKSGQIVLWVTIVGICMFLYNVNELKNVENDVSAWWAQVDANSNPGAGSFMKAFFDGATLGAFSNGDIFAEAHKLEQNNQQLEAARLVLLKRYNNATFYRNVGFVLFLVGVAAGIYLKKKASAKVA